jgi:hypothetical protein
LYGNGKGFEKNPENKNCSEIMYEVFDLTKPMCFEKLLLISINLMKSKQIKANLKSRKFRPNLYGKKNKMFPQSTPKRDFTAFFFYISFKLRIL